MKPMNSYVLPDCIHFTIIRLQPFFLQNINGFHMSNKGTHPGNIFGVCVCVGGGGGGGGGGVQRNLKHSRRNTNIFYGQILGFFL